MEDVRSAGLSVQLLGPVRAHIGAREIHLGPTRRRTLFAMLAMRAGEIVSLEDIVDGLWADPPRGNPAGSIYTYINGLRRALDPQRDPRSSASLLQSASPGYRLLADNVDVARVTAHLSAGRTLLATDLDAAISEFNAALGIWHDDPLAGTSGPFAQTARLHLLEQRYGLVEDHATALLTLGRHGEVIGELRELIRAYPLRERPRGLLMQALYRGERADEALAVFADFQTVLNDELGIDPSSFLCQLRDRITAQTPSLLSGPPQPALESTRSAPVNLPHAVPTFTGRHAELAWLRALTTPVTTQAAERPVVGVISGPAGVGKTALALQIAHELGDRFPDGRFFVNLRGFDAHEPPVSPAQTIAKLLGDLGGAVMSESEAELSGQLRSILSGKRVLLVLDNALSSEQIRPLLPGSSCLVLVTSRNRLDGLVARDDAHVLDLRPLRPRESIAFLTRLVDEKRTAGAADDLGRIADLCGHLPLALNIVGRRLTSRPTLQLSDVIVELSNESNRLSALTSDSTDHDGIRPVFSWSYQALKPEPAKIFRRLGLHPNGEISVAAAAALNGTTVPETRRLLETLANSHLIEWAGRGRYQIHDLLRPYSKELVRDQETIGERAVAIRRLFDWYLHTSDNAYRVLDPIRETYRLPFEGPPGDCRPLEFADGEAADRWVAAESDGLLSIVRYAAELGYDEYIWKIVSAVSKHLQYGPQIDEWIKLKELAVTAAEKQGNSYAQMWLTGELAYACHYASRIDRAFEYWSTCLHYWTTVGADQPWAKRQEASALTGSAHILHSNGELEKALEYCHKAFTIVREGNDQENKIWTLNNMGVIYRKMGRLTEAEAVLRQGLMIRKAQGWRELLVELYLLRHLAQVEQNLGQLEQAAAHLNHALTIAQGIDNPLSELRILHNLQQVLHELGQVDEASTCQRLAGELIDKFAIPATVLNALANE